MNILILLLILILIFGGVGWHGGYGPVYYGGGIGTIVVILLILWMCGILR